LILAKSYFEADELNFPTSLAPRIYNITLKASDKFSTIYKTRRLETQNVISVNANTLPINTSVIFDDNNLF
jgi:hypothetical protein